MNRSNRWAGRVLAVALLASPLLLALTHGAEELAMPMRGAIPSPLFGVTIPMHYRRWELLAPSHRPDLGELRGIVGNDIALDAYRGGELPFPDGAILVKLAWKHVASAEEPNAFVPGSATTLQVMVKNSRRYAETGGWGFGRFVDGEPASEAEHRACFACHQALVKEHDFVFTRLAP